MRRCITVSQRILHFAVSKKPPKNEPEAEELLKQFKSWFLHWDAVDCTNWIALQAINLIVREINEFINSSARDPVSTSSYTHPDLIDLLSLETLINVLLLKMMYCNSQICFGVAEINDCSTMAFLWLSPLWTYQCLCQSTTQPWNRNMSTFDCCSVHHSLHIHHHWNWPQQNTWTSTSLSCNSLKHQGMAPIPQMIAPTETELAALQLATCPP